MPADSLRGMRRCAGARLARRPRGGRRRVHAVKDHGVAAETELRQPFEKQNRLVERRADRRRNDGVGKTLATKSLRDRAGA